MLRIREILTKLANDWAIRKRRYDRITKSKRFPGISAELDDKEEEARWAAYHDHPFPYLVADLSERTGCDHDEILEWALKKSNGAREIVLALNALDGSGETAELFANLQRECPDIVQQLLPGKEEVEPTLTAKGQRTEQAGSTALAKEDRSPKRKRGRPQDTDPEEDQRVEAAWHSDRYRSKAELARALGEGWTLVKVKNALERQRSRKRYAAKKLADK